MRVSDSTNVPYGYKGAGSAKRDINRSKTVRFESASEP